MKMVKCLPEFEYFTVFLKNSNFISKIRISKVTDYAALILMLILKYSPLPTDVCRSWTHNGLIYATFSIKPYKLIKISLNSFIL